MNLWTFMLVAVAVIQLIGLAVFFFGLVQAPEGYQDAAGFHPGSEPDAVAMPDRGMIVMTRPVGSETFGHAA